MTTRPLSPHLQVYRPQLTSVLSIMHRGTGVFLSIGTLVLVYWLMAAALGAESYAQARTLLGSIPGQLLLAAWTLAFYYHLANGVRHLLWDAGWCFELDAVDRTGYAVVAFAVVCTLATWGYVLASAGGAS